MDKEKREALEHLNALSDKFREAYADKEWVREQTKGYLQDAKELDDKRFRSWAGTFTKFLK